MRIRFVDLFAGIGGMRNAFEQIGAECVFSSEICEKAKDTYEANFGERPYGDIRNIDEEIIPDHDILLGGIPIQGFSLAGFSNDLRETLIFDIVRILRAKHPKAFLLEYARGLLANNRGETLKKIINIFNDLGYEVNYKIINAKGLVPQNKERLYIVGFRESVNFEFPFIPQQGLPFKSILEDYVDDKYTLSNEKWNRIRELQKKGAHFSVVDINSYSRPLLASANILIPQTGGNPRMITPRECARLQGFPDSFIIPISDANAYKHFGTSSVIPVIRTIAEKMIQALKQKEPMHSFNIESQPIKRENVLKVIDDAEKYGRFYCKFLSANDLGSNVQSNQAGVYISKKAGPLFFENIGRNGELLSKPIKIHLPYQDQPIESMAKWYGSKSEYRITRFWAKTGYNREEQYGNLLILIKCDEDTFLCHILDNDEDIEKFLKYFKINPTSNSEVYGFEKSDILHDKQLEIYNYTNTLKDFPATVEIALKAREIWFNLNGRIKQPDSALLDWVGLEFEIFKSIEENLYQDYINKPFGNINFLIESANSILNRRKSRAGKSLEHHVNYLLNQYDIPFSHPGVSEGKKKPDFIMPSNQEYADKSFPDKGLTFLGAKTTCKDRWRQILNEADRIPNKHLITLQQSISVNQLEEMKKHKVILVVPKRYHKFYPSEYREELLSVDTFIHFLKEKYGV